jgi:hypothetical protein
MLTLFIVIVLAILVARGISNRLDPARPRRAYYWKYGKYARSLKPKDDSENET